jgi:hypothetical protein
VVRQAQFCSIVENLCKGLGIAVLRLIKENSVAPPRSLAPCFILRRVKVVLIGWIKIEGTLLEVPQYFILFLGKLTEFITLVKLFVALFVDSLADAHVINVNQSVVHVTQYNLDLVIKD